MATEDDRVVESIYDALDGGRADEALRLAREARSASEEDDPVLRFLAGVALLELDAPDEAAVELDRACRLDPDDAEFRSALALARFRACRFDDAEREARRALESDGEMPDAHHAFALALERRGRIDEADRHLAAASDLDPERFPPPVRLPEAAFAEVLREAGDLLPADFRRHLGDVAVTVEPLPSDEILRDGAPPLDPELLGLFVGAALPDRTHLGPGGELPPRILLFQRNLERYAADEKELREEIAVTLYHELGHYLGLDEDELEDLDLG